MAYVFGGAGSLAAVFLTFFGTPAAQGITAGIRLELLLMIVAVFVFVRLVRRDWRPALFASVLVYLIAFVWVSLPVWLYLIMPGGASLAADGGTTTDFLQRASGTSLTAFSLNDAAASLPPDRGAAVFFNGLMGRLHLLLLVALAALWYSARSWNRFRAIVGNSRPERLVHWLAMISVGGLAALTLLGRYPLGWNDWLATTVLLLSFYAAWMFAVCSNDLADWRLDAIANPKRPLPSGLITAEEMASVGRFFLIVSLLGGWLLGPPVMFAVMGFTAAYWVYSMPPLRLKRWPMLNSFLVSLACLSAALAGFFLTSPGAALSEFPGRLALLLVIAFTLSSNVKDLKDVEGDRTEGINTIPVLLGEKRGRLAIGVMLMASFWLVPLLLNMLMLTVTAFPAGLIALYLTTRPRFKEIQVFVLYYVFVAVSVGILAMAPFT